MRNRNAFFLFFACIALTISCGDTGSAPVTKQTSPEVVAIAGEGDSAIYGLACDGCNDTIVLLLRHLEGDPDTFNILDAMRQHRVYGRPKIGDRMALLVDSDSTVARMVIDIDQLCDSWCYLAVPKLRRSAAFSEQMQQQFLRNMPDSVRDSLFRPREQGFRLQADGRVTPIGLRPGTNGDSPVEYPKMKFYRQWRLCNGRLVLTEATRDTLGNHNLTDSDTALFVRLRRDTLVLQFDSVQQGYYRQHHD